MDGADSLFVGREQHAQAPPAIRSWLRIARLALGIGLIVYLTWSTAIEWSRLLGLVHALPLTVSALLLLFLAVLGTSWRLSMLLSGVGLRLSLGASLRLSLIGGFFNNFLPGSSGGDLVRIYLAAPPGQLAEVGVTLLIDRVIGVMAFMLAPLLLAVFQMQVIIHHPALALLLTVAAGGSLFLVLIVFFGVRRCESFLLPALRVLNFVRLRGLGERFFVTVHAHSQNMPLPVRALGISLLVQALVIFSYQMILLANGAASMSWQTALLTPFGLLANALPLTPGGLGVGEAAFETLFLSVGVRGGAEAILSWRLLTTVLDLFGGVFLLMGRTDMGATDHKMSV